MTTKVNETQELFNQLVKEAKVEKELIQYKQLAISHIKFFIERYELDQEEKFATAIEKLHGSMVSIHTSKNKEQVDFYLNNTDTFINEITTGLERGWF